MDHNVVPLHQFGFLNDCKLVHVLKPPAVINMKMPVLITIVHIFVSLAVHQRLATPSHHLISSPVSISPIPVSYAKLPPVTN
jgi:hypothetical protein